MIIILKKEVPMEQTSKHFRKRDAILTCVRATDVHPSADWVYARLKPEFPDISLGTVYRNLNRFRAESKVCCVATVRGTERFDANTTPHVHFICSHCDAVIDLKEMQVPESLSNTAAEYDKRRFTAERCNSSWLEW